MPVFPSGVITLVFTDIEGSSSLWEAHREAFAPVLARHNLLLRQAAERWHGVEVKTEGDAFFLVFARASDAVRFAIDAQLALASSDWPAVLAGLAELRVRIGMHTGEPILSQHPDGSSDYFGPTVNRAARVGAAGHGGQIVVSEATRGLAMDELPADITFVDLGRHRLKGVGDETLWQACHPGLPDRFPPLKTLAGARHNLPQPATPFIGREKEVAEWSALLRDPQVRLLTLMGFGGQGKTRLALQLAESLLQDFEDGVWWIELDEARDGDAMVSRIAHELRIHLQPQPTVREQLLNFHRERNLLLVLDNTEQIPDAGQVVNELLAAGPGIKCLVTTRRALEVRAERRVQVPPLPSADAVALFVERAASRASDMVLTADDHAAIAELCRRLEGVPLAIELAASRISVLSPGEMLERLDERFRLLQSRAPDLPPRQRALRGAIDWSYDLLGPDDRALLAELSVFAGGFGMDAAEAVVDERLEVLEGVAELHRHSLLREDEATPAGRKKRFSMQESVRAYAAEKLGDMPTEDALRLRHADYYLRFANIREAKLRTSAEGAALEELLSERANLRAALNWAAATTRGALTVRLALALYEPLHRLGFWDEARSVLLQAAAVPGCDEDGTQSAAMKLKQASLAHDTGEAAAALRDAEAALQLARQHNDLLGQAESLNLLGLLASDRDEGEAARQYFEGSLALRAGTDHHGHAVALHNLALLASRRGAVPESRRLYEEALQHRKASGDGRGEAETLGNLGVLLQKSGDLAGARDLYLQSLRLRRALRDRIGIALMLYNLAEIAELEDDFTRAAILYHHSGCIFRELGSAYATAADQALAKLEARAGAEAVGKAATEGQAWEDWIGGS